MTGRAAMKIVLPDFSLIKPDWPGLPANVHAYTTTRKGGVSLAPFDGGHTYNGFNLASHVGDDPVAVARNHQRLNLCLPSPVTFLSQVHGNVASDAAKIFPGHRADACFTTETSVVCAVLTADCLPVLFSDTKGGVVAAAHAGWRGLASGILQMTAQKMRESGAKEIIAWLGPAIGPTQFEVGQDVFDAFSQVLKNASAYFKPKQTEHQFEAKYLADIYGLARNLLSEVGINQVDGGIYCTVTESDKFYSYRRDGVTGRMASVIWMD